MSHISATINTSPASIIKAHRIVNAHARLRLRSQARTGPVEGKAWAVVDALYATLGPLILRDATIFAEHRLGIKDMESKTKKRKDGTTYEEGPRAPTIKEDDIIAALKQHECFPIELDTKGGMSSTRKRQRQSDEEEDDDDVAAEPEPAAKVQRAEKKEKKKKQKLATKEKQKAAAAEEEEEEEEKAPAKAGNKLKKAAAAEEEEDAPAKASAEAEDSD